MAAGAACLAGAAAGAVCGAACVEAAGRPGTGFVTGAGFWTGFTEAGKALLAEEMARNNAKTPDLGGFGTGGDGEERGGGEEDELGLVHFELIPKE